MRRAEKLSFSNSNLDFLRPTGWEEDSENFVCSGTTCQVKAKALESVVCIGHCNVFGKRAVNACLRPFAVISQRKLVDGMRFLVPCMAANEKTEGNRVHVGCGMQPLCWRS